MRIVHDPDTMVDPLTHKTIRKAEALARAPPTILNELNAVVLQVFIFIIIMNQQSEN